MTESLRPSASGSSSPVPRRTKRPSWLDLRLILGVVLVLGSVLVGAVVVSKADRRDSVWAISRDLSAGSVLQSSDVRPMPVQLGVLASSYLEASTAVVGRSISRPVRAGQLLPRDALTDPIAGLLIAIPVRQDNAPRVSRGDLVTIWVTTKSCRAVVLLDSAPVQDVRSASGGALSGGASFGLLLRLSAGDAQRVMGVLDIDGAVIRVGLVSSEIDPSPVSGQRGRVGDVSGCDPAAA